jgi:ATP-dependent Clp protease adaptor protein ClpS
MGDRERKSQRDGDVGLKERDDQRLQPPRKYRVVLLNDDFTPIQFVVALVQQVFRKSNEEAIAITMQVHEKGMGVAGVYTYEIAETKVAQASMHARRHEHPLMVTMEPDD